ncbi:MAG: aminoglycoside phosphotransferase family protein [Bacillota bacterium]|nr:aminoglycoside phosphotransferase family protein [Bacillota bacterium]
MLEQEATIRKVLLHYDLDGTLCELTQLVNGHINDTFQVCLDDNGDRRQYILQRINDYVFKNPALVMDNILAISQYLESRLSCDDCSIITFLNNRDGRNHTVCDSGTWRLCPYIDNSVAYEQVENSQVLVSAGYAFGRFQALLAEMPIDRLAETIPGFHHTPGRLQQLFDVARRDPMGRASAVARELDFFRSNSELAGRLSVLQQQGVLPLRVTHNDTKYNNILMDRNSGKPLCVIDLDTVMPGLSMHDFGDAIRFAANDAVEDETDLDKVRLNMDHYEAFTRGFMGAAGSFLTPNEVDHMALGAIVITIELASRFLADHIDGDRYFRIHRPGHNLDRARSQIRLAEDMLAHLDEMNAIVKQPVKSFLTTYLVEKEQYSNG